MICTNFFEEEKNKDRKKIRERYQIFTGEGKEKKVSVLSGSYLNIRKMINHSIKGTIRPRYKLFRHWGNTLL